MGVVGRELVGDEHGVEQAALHGARHVLPIFGAGEVPADLVLRMTPHAGGVTVHAVLDEAQKMRTLFVLFLHEQLQSDEAEQRRGTAQAFGTDAERLLPTKKATPTPVAVTMASIGPA